MAIIDCFLWYRNDF